MWKIIVIKKTACLPILFILNNPVYLSKQPSPRHFIVYFTFCHPSLNLGDFLLLIRKTCTTNKLTKYLVSSVSVILVVDNRKHASNIFSDILFQMFFTHFIVVEVLLQMYMIHNIRAIS